MRLRSFFEIPTAYSRIDMLIPETINDKNSRRILFVCNSSTQYIISVVIEIIRMPGNTSLARYLLTVKSEILVCSISNRMICARTQSPIIVTNT